MERVTGIEPALYAWEAHVLPLNYTRITVCEFTLFKQVCNNKFHFGTEIYAISFPAKDSHFRYFLVDFRILICYKTRIEILYF